jgi:regulator of cell morphogenesis and NO signaling
MSLAELANTRRGATAVFHEHGLDFCCGGQRSLAVACAERGLDAEALLAAIDKEEAAETDVARWAGAADAELIRHIVDDYHVKLRRDLRQVIEMAERVEARHAGRPDLPVGLSRHLTAMAHELEQHMMKEEQILFPMVLSGRGAMAGGPIRVMEGEHADAAADLARTRALTAELAPPADACNTWRSLYLRLGALESDLKDHIHLENNILFPRILSH